MEELIFDMLVKFDKKYPLGISIETVNLDKITVGGKQLKNMQIVYKTTYESAFTIFLRLLDIIVGLDRVPTEIDIGNASFVVRIVDVGEFYRVILCDNDGNAKQSMAFPHFLQYSDQRLYPFSMN